ncbi:MAG TPA: TetR/AcrR family transcriptional regulator [Solirubrobacteraceae bacterium]|nr:TetR/AcrR family transcriptional regulator [Solirubrobacteraceae bacterium]
MDALNDYRRVNSASQAAIAAAPIASLMRDPGRQLPAGRKPQGRSKAQGRSAVSAIQRDRMITAVIQAVEEVGYARMTVNEVIGRARVSRKTFYDLFADREACFLATFDQMLAETRPAVEQAYASQSNWRGGVRSALTVLLDLLDQSSGLAKLFVVESMAGGERMLRRRAEVVDELTRTIDQGRRSAAGKDPPTITAQALVGGVLGVLHMRIVRNDQESFGVLLGPLMSMIVLPYLGAGAAAQELRAARSHENERHRRARSRPAKDPLDGLKMRVTYRTMLVLAMIAQHPGANNREIAEGSGIVDQGQISKLLSRLAGLALIENHGAGQPHGAANQWYLTGLGAQLELATRRR